MAARYEYRSDISSFYGMRQVYMEALFENALMAEVINTIGQFALPGADSGDAGLSTVNENIAGYLLTRRLTISAMRHNESSHGESISSHVLVSSAASAYVTLLFS